MNGKVLLRGGMIFATLLLAAGHFAQAQVTSSFAVNSLSDAYVLLARAKPVYNGHRGKAMQHIRVAAYQLRGKINGKKLKEPERETDSDVKMRAAQSLLRQIREGLTGKTLQHVDAAIKEISLGLNDRQQ